MTATACVLFAHINPSASYWLYSFWSTLLIVVGAGIVNMAGAVCMSKNTKAGEQNLLQVIVWVRMVREFLVTLTGTRWTKQIGFAIGLVVSTIVFNSVVNQRSSEFGIVVNATESNVPASVELLGYRAAQWTGAGFSFLGTHIYP